MTSIPKDSAIGPISGYLFQFEKALLVIARLSSSSDYVTIEQVDDIASHSSDGTVLLTVQAKHSISSSGSAYGDTSTALWRTIEIWVEKLKSGVFDSDTIFMCCSNLSIPNDSLLAKFKSGKIEEVLKSIEELKKDQEAKLNIGESKNSSSGNTIKTTIKRIKNILAHKDELEIVIKNIDFESLVNVKEDFLNAIHANREDLTEEQKDKIYSDFNGWIVTNCKAKWKNGSSAKFTKTAFDTKLGLIVNNPAIVNAIFRTKKLIGSIPDDDINKRKNDLFVRQIEDINRKQDAKERAIKNAILDFIYADIELQYIVDKGDFTEKDFEEFLAECCNRWQSKYDEIVLKETNEYNNDELNELAIELFDYTMNHLKMSFMDGYMFSPQNEYLRRGCFLKLSDIPTIGWHPEWEKKYK